MAMLQKIKKKILLRLFSLIEDYRLKIEKAKIHDMNFKKRGKSFNVGKDYKFVNPQYIEFGENFYAESRLKIDAIDCYRNDNFTPEILIGENVTFINDIHIGCINKIVIGDGCLFASKVYISDHSHGEITKESLQIMPNDRPLISKGAVIIGKNVWIGEGAAILPNVTIGDNCIIGTNAVVTKSIPPNSIVAGVPAKVIKNFN